MPAINDSTNEGYSSRVAFIFVFNLIVGAGALTIPNAFARVGLIPGTIAICLLAFLSYMSSTFVVEVMAGVNALYQRKARTIALTNKVLKLSSTESGQNKNAGFNDEDERTEAVPLLLATENDSNRSDFEIVRKIEMAAMAEELFGQKGLFAFYACITIYLYGDLAIYAVAVPKSLREITCPRPANYTQSAWPCVRGYDSGQVYRLYVALFAAVLGPFAYGQMQKTRYLQLFTTIMRHSSFFIMILIASVAIFRGQGRKFGDVIEHVDVTGFATFFGVCIYSFMCHHSLPGLITPVIEKNKIGSVLVSSFTVVVLGYLVLCYSADFRYSPEEIHDVYTLNFQSFSVRSIAYFLSLFPVFTLSSNFPLIAITLRENLKTLISSHSRKTKTVPTTASASEVTTYLWQYFYATIAIAPPLLLALFTENVAMLVGFTGSYAGLGIQWVIPACLVHRLRLKLRQIRDEDLAANGLTGSDTTTNCHMSPFSSACWIYILLAWSLGCIVVVTAIHIVHS